MEQLLDKEERPPAEPTGAHQISAANQIETKTTTTSVIEIMSIDEAKAITNRIRQMMAIAWTCIVDAYNGRAWVALGYSSWDAYCNVEFDGAQLRLPREERQEVVASLRDAGLSLRAIESATGVSKKTIISDIQVVESTPRATPSDDCRKITGTDGKVYRPKLYPDRDPFLKGTRHFRSESVVTGLRNEAINFEAAAQMLIDKIDYSVIENSLIDETITACKAAAAEYRRLARRLRLELDRRVTP